MKKILILAGLLIASTAAYAEALNYNVIGLSAKAEREVPNDLMSVQLMVEHQANKAQQVSQKVNADMSWALAQLKSKRALNTKHSSTARTLCMRKRKLRPGAPRSS